MPLRDNVFLVTLGPSVSAWSLVAYDRNGLVIGSTYAVVAIGFALAFTVLPDFSS